jgi:hypothetical protein
MQKQSDSVTGIVWENTFSTEFKHASIEVNGAVAVVEKFIAINGMCVMGATALDASAPGRIYRCRVKVIKWGDYAELGLGMMSQNIGRANKF